MYKRFHEVYQSWVDRELRNEAVYNTTKMRKIILLFLSAVLIGGNLLLTGCEVDYYQEPEPTEGSGSSLFEDGITVPDGFDWSLLKSGNLAVKVDDRFNGRYFYQVEVYDANPLFNMDAKLLAKGVAKQSQDWIGSINLPSDLETVYVRQVSPVGQGVVKVATVSENGMKVDFTPNTSGGTRMVSASVPPASTTMSTRSGGDNPSTSYTTPAVDNNAVLELSGSGNFSLQAGKTYVIPAGKAFTGNITFSWTNSILYVEGTWINTSANIALNGWTVIVQESGKFTSNVGGTFKLNPNNGQGGQLVVADGGEFSTEGELMTLSQGDNNSKIVNSGTILTSGLSQVRSLYNYGDITVNGKMGMDSNTSNLVNKGNLIVNNAINDINIIQGNFLNDGVAKITGTLDFDSNNFSLTNNGFFEVGSLGVYTNPAQGTVNNSGQFIATNAYLELTFNISTGALFEVANLTMFNSLFHLENEAMLVVTERLTVSTSGSAKIIEGPGAGAALARIKEVAVPSYTNFILRGELEVECSNYTELPESGTDQDGKYTGEDVRFVKVGESTVKIPESDYNKGGNNNQVTGNPENPVFPIIFDGSPLTYMFEDNWPYLGDYDMNDLVLDVMPTYSLNESNKVTKLELDVTLRAVGATKRSAVGIQLDGIVPSNISNVTRSNNAGLNNQVFTQNSGLETGQTYAVIPVFDDAHSAFGHTSALMTNTIVGSENNRSPVNVAFTIVFSSPIDLASITVDKFNVFIVNGGYKGKRSEVHMAGFQPTDKADKSKFGHADSNATTPYVSKNNMIWGLAVPGPAKYPNEWTSISSVYTYLEGWATSAGSDNKDWYKYPDEGKIFGN